MKRDAAHHSLQWNTTFFSKVNLILFVSSHFLLLPSFVNSLVAFDTNKLIGPIWIIRGLSSASGCRQAEKPFLFLCVIESHPLFPCF